MNFLFIALIFLSSGCASLDLHNFRDEFHQFMENSGGKSEDVAWVNWQKTVEKKDKNYFQKVVAESASEPNWQEKYRKSFGKAWPVLQKYEAKIDEEFRLFPQLLQKNASVFIQMFPDFDLSKTPIFAVPSLKKFNGKGTEARVSKALSFGIDTIVFFFFFFRNEPQIVPRASLATDADLLMDSNLSQACKRSGDDLVEKFVVIGDARTQSAKGQELYRKWFLLSSEDASIPLRAAYCVGLLLVRRIAKTGLSVKDMAAWPYEKVPENIRYYIRNKSKFSEKTSSESVGSTFL